MRGLFDPNAGAVPTYRVTTDQASRETQVSDQAAEWIASAHIDGVAVRCEVEVASLRRESGLLDNLAHRVNLKLTKRNWQGPAWKLSDR